MKHYVSLFLLLLTVSFGLSSCHHLAHVRSEQKVELLPEAQQVYTVPMPQQVKAIVAERGIEVKYSYGQQPQIVVHTNLSDSTLIDIRQENTDLILSYDDDLHNLDDVQTTIEIITARPLYHFTASSGANIKFVQRNFKADSLNLNADSGGEIAISVAEVRTALSINTSSAGKVVCDTISTSQCHLDASAGSYIGMYNSKVFKSVKAIASSGANINLQGSTPSVYYEASSGADIRAQEMYAQQGYAEASSGASIYSANKQHQEQVTSGGSVDNQGKDADTSATASKGRSSFHLKERKNLRPT